MALAQPAYRYDAYPDHAADVRHASDVRAMRTGGSREESSTPLLVTAAKMAAILLFVVAALAFARITLTSATVTTMIESDALSSEIADARSDGVVLEMEQSVLSNTSAINIAAKRLGMKAPAEVGTIALSADVVSVDADGNLSLSGTVRKLVETQG